MDKCGLSGHYDSPQSPLSPLSPSSELNMTYSPASSLTNRAILAAIEAGDLLRKGFGTQYKVYEKEGKHNFVTDLDHAAETCIMASIRSQFPDHAFLCEESGASPSNPSSVLWIIDPLDGTLNFSHHVPIFVTSIGAYYQGEMVCGVVYQPMTQELFIAEKGRGAYLNGQRIHVSKTSDLANAYCSVSLPVNDPERSLHPFAELIKNRNPMREIGAAVLSLAYVAAGRFDLFWIPMLYPWDAAAGGLLVEEAGGRVSHHDGKPYDLFSKEHLLATNGLLHDDMIKILNI